MPRSERAAVLARRAALLGALAAMSGCMLPTASGPQAAQVQVYAAGSLREAFTEIAREHEARTGQRVALVFGASGLLRERIEGGEGAQVFASADTDHPQRLARRGGWAKPWVFTRNALCALTGPRLGDVAPDGVLPAMLRGDVRLGTSTPRADPSGDYAWVLFRQADALQPGAYAQLDAKALRLTGGPDSPKPPAGRGTYAWIMEQDQADLFLTYCTNAVAARAEWPALRVAPLPAALQVGAAYGLTVREDAPAAAHAFAAALLDAPAQAVLRRLGFGAP
ncbi:MAG: molybdate ABC transporter substrate-binding protein [Acidovorax sp.]|nr:molybdate ABC transporter substrate-binding protein [Acidovorax sp.]